jgi:hypothetical protein
MPESDPLFTETRDSRSSRTSLRIGEKQTSSRRGEEHTVIPIERFKTDFRRSQ